MIVFKCGQCGAAMEVPDSLAGEVETCPECKSPNRVPRAARAAVAAQPPAELGRAKVSTTGSDIGRPARAMSQGVEGKKMHWAGILALLIGLIAGGWLAKNLWEARQKTRLQYALAQVRYQESLSESSRSLRESSRSARDMLPDHFPNTSLGRYGERLQRQSERNIEALTRQLEALNREEYIEAHLAKGGLEKAAWPMAILGGALGLLGISIAVRTRKKEVGLGIAAVLLFLGALAGGCVLTGLADAGLHAELTAIGSAPK